LAGCLKASRRPARQRPSAAVERVHPQGLKLKGQPVRPRPHVRRRDDRQDAARRDQPRHRSSPATQRGSAGAGSSSRRPRPCARPRGRRPPAGPKRWTSPGHAGGSKPPAKARRPARPRCDGSSRFVPPSLTLRKNAEDGGFGDGITDGAADCLRGSNRRKQ
jgi:hypothetical protein